MQLQSNFKDAMFNAGLITDVPIIADGEIHRFKPDGDKRENGWYIYFGDGGAFGSWKLGLTEKWFRKNLDKCRRTDISKEIKAAKILSDKKKIANQKSASVVAASRWKQATPIVDASRFPYLAKKQVKAYGLRAEGDNILVPMCIDRKVWSIQTISPDGSKRFQYQGRVAGC